jgi:hypothetical protein
MADVQKGAKYILTNSLIGSTKGLASISANDSVVVVSLDSNGSQSWYFLETTTSGYYRLHTQQKGDFAALDVYNYNGKNSLELHMFAVQENTGQFWRLNQQNDGSVKINNQFTGPDIYLDIVPDTLQPTLAAKDGPGQRCTYDLYRKISMHALTYETRDAQPSRIVAYSNTIEFTRRKSICDKYFHIWHKHKLNNKRHRDVGRLIKRSNWRYRRRIGRRFGSRGNWRFLPVE